MAKKADATPEAATADVATPEATTLVTTAEGVVQVPDENLTVELGEFRLKANNEAGAEVRLSDEKHQSSIVSRFKTANRKLEPGATYTVLLVLNQPATEAAMVDVKVPAESTGSLPAGSVIIEGGKGE